MDEEDVPRKKFADLVKFIPLLENFLKLGERKTTNHSEKLTKVNTLLKLLKAGYKSQKIELLNNIEKAIHQIVTYQRIKQEKIDKMDNFQSPESPPMYEAERKDPIQIPMERKESKNERVYDNRTDFRRQGNQLHQAGTSHFNRNRFSRSRSRSRSNSSSRSRERYREFRTDRRYRSRSRDRRDRSRSRERVDRGRDRFQNNRHRLETLDDYRGRRERKISPSPDFDRGRWKNRDHDVDFKRHWRDRDIKRELDRDSHERDTRKNDYFKQERSDRFNNERPESSAPSTPNPFRLNVKDRLGPKVSEDKLDIDVEKKDVLSHYRGKKNRFNARPPKSVKLEDDDDEIVGNFDNKALEDAFGENDKDVKTMGVKKKFNELHEAEDLSKIIHNKFMSDSAKAAAHKFINIDIEAEIKDVLESFNFPAGDEPTETTRPTEIVRPEIIMQVETARPTVPSLPGERIALKYLRKPRTHAEDTTQTTERAPEPFQSNLSPPNSADHQQDPRLRNRDPRASNNDPNIFATPNTQHSSLSETFNSFAHSSVSPAPANVDFGRNLNPTPMTNHQNFNANQQNYMPPLRNSFYPQQPIPPNHNQLPQQLPQLPTAQMPQTSAQSNFSPTNNRLHPDNNMPYSFNPIQSNYQPSLISIRSNSFENHQMHQPGHQPVHHPPHQQSAHQAHHPQHQQFNPPPHSGPPMRKSNQTYKEYKEQQRREREQQRREEERQRREEAQKAVAAAVSSSTETLINATAQPLSTQTANNQEGSNKPSSTQSKEANKEQSPRITSNTAKKTHFDRGFSNGWDQIPKASGIKTSFKIPKLNKPDTNISSSSKNDTTAMPSTSVSSNKSDEQDKNASKKKESSTKTTAETQKSDKETRKSKRASKSSEQIKESAEKQAGSKELIQNVQTSADTTVQSESEPAPQKETPQAALPTTGNEADLLVQKLIGKIMQKCDTNKLLDMFASALDKDEAKAMAELISKRNESNEDAIDQVSSSTPQGQANVSVEVEITEKPTTTNAEAKVEEEEEEEPQTPKKPKGKRGTNELERLHKDIRNMFIRDGVLNANGRRICTLLNKEKEPADDKKTSPKTPTTSKSKIANKAEPPAEKEKPARVLRRRNTAIFDVPPPKESEDESEEQETRFTAQRSGIIPVAKRINRRRDTVCEVIDTHDKDATKKPSIKIKIFNRNSTDSQSSANKDKSDDESSEDKAVEVAKRPATKVQKATKGKKTKSDEPLKLTDCHVVLRNIDVDVERLTRSRARSRVSETTTNDSESVSQSNEPDKTTSNESFGLVERKNIDRSMTFKSAKQCALCTFSNKLGLTNHYVTEHPGEECYNARLSVNMANRLRKQGAKKAQTCKWLNGKASVFCYFCEKDVNNDRCNWITHLARHTGEFKRQCSKCELQITESTKCNCGASNIRIIPNRDDFVDTIKIFVCDDCNYAQFDESHLKSHVREMHDAKAGYSGLVWIQNFGRYIKRNKPSNSKLDSAAESRDELPNQDVFEQSDKDDNSLFDSDRMQVLKDNTFSKTEPMKKSTSTLADRLYKRFQQQEEQQQTNAEVKSEEDLPLDPPKCTAQENVVNPCGNVHIGDTNVGNTAATEVAKSEVKTNPESDNAESDDDPNWESFGSTEEEESDVGNVKSPRLRLISGKSKRSKLRLFKSKKPGPLKKEKSDLNESTASETGIRSPEKSFNASPAKPTISLIQKTTTRVDNIGYTDYMGLREYQCNIGNCGFVTSKSAKDLFVHLREHSEPWTGLCHACDKQILNGTFALSREFKHMDEAHIVKTTAVKEVVDAASQPPVVPPIQQTPPQVEVVPPQPVEQPKKIVLKCRRFSGDKLSTPFEMQQPQPTGFVIANIASGAVQTMATENQEIPISNPVDTVYDNKIKPWTECMNKKSEIAILQLTRDASLVALYKCMAIDCIFTTNDPDSMLQHLNNHETFISEQMASPSNVYSDSDSWLECAYCDNIADSCKLLVDHIRNIHSSSIYQCAYCFYRSVESANVYSHLNHYHTTAEKLIFVCGCTPKPLSEDVPALGAAQMYKPQPLALECQEQDCNRKFDDLDSWKIHELTDHSNLQYYTCFYCKTHVGKSTKDRIDLGHMIEHNTAFCYCVHCPFNCKDIEAMRTHMRESHTAKLAYAVMYKKIGVPNFNKNPIIVRLYEDIDPKYFCHTGLSEPQLNYMKPSLSDYTYNSHTPMIDNDPSLTELHTQALKNACAREEQEAGIIWRKYNIKMFSDILNEPVQEETIQAPPAKRPRTESVASTSSASDVINSTESSFQLAIDLAAKTLVNGTGLENEELFRCGSKDCGFIGADERIFQVHLTQHQSTEFACSHCSETFMRPVDLKNHIRVHAKHRFFCYFCHITGSTYQYMTDHYSDIHKNVDCKYLPLNANDFDMSKDMFVVCPRNIVTINEFAVKLVENYNNIILSTKRYYLPEEAEMLPKRPVVYHEPVFCQRCHYSTKVRKNLYNHLVRDTCVERTEAEPEMAPVNPVPCLDTGERHFDKMKNLAASSNSNAMNPDQARQFIPKERRFVCGAKNCRYQTQTDDMLRQHIDALHTCEQYYKCPHCLMDLSVSLPKTISSVDIMNHMLYHDEKLFKCPMCEFYHYTKTGVDKHIAEFHPRVKDRPLTVIRKDSKKVEVSKVGGKPVIWKWKCNICSNVVLNTRSLIRQHLIEKHSLSHQYQCLICSFQSDVKGAVKEHLTNDHKAGKFKTNFEKVEGEVDNTPIWRRDDPTRIKHIRGILVAEEEEPTDDNMNSDAEEASSSKSHSIHLEIKPMTFIPKNHPNSFVAPKQKNSMAPTGSRQSVNDCDVPANPNKKLVCSKAAKDLFVGFVRKPMPRKRSNSISGHSEGITGNDDEPLPSTSAISPNAKRFIILPAKEITDAENARPRPAMLRQMPKRRFSTFVSSPTDFQSLTNQPPISIRLKRVSDPTTDTDVKLMPPPSNLIRTPPPSTKPAFDLSTVDLVYLCKYCEESAPSFDQIHSHWLNCHKKATNIDVSSQRFCYRITMKVRCLHCTDNVTFYTIRKHMETQHSKRLYAFAKNISEKLECGVCSTVAKSAADMEGHFLSKHMDISCARNDLKIEPLSSLNDEIIKTLLEQGDSGTFRCGFCHRFFTCRYDYEQHHNERHATLQPLYEINGTDVIKYGCHLCRDIFTDEKEAVKHIKAHLPNANYMCKFCPKRFQHVQMVKKHHLLIHKSIDAGYRIVDARENIQSFYPMTMNFANGLLLIFGDLTHTKYADVERLVSYVNDLNKSAIEQQPGKIGNRRQTML